MKRNPFFAVAVFCNSLVQRHLAWIFRLTTSRPLPTLCLFLLLTGMSAASVATIHFDTDIFRLFPTRQPALKLLLDSLEWTGSANDAYFLLEGNKETLPAEAGRFTARLEQSRIDGEPAFKRVTWRVYDERQAAAFNRFISFAVANPQAFLRPEDVGRFSERYTVQQTETYLQQLQSELAVQIGGGMTGLLTADPLYLRDFILPRLKSGSQSLDLDQTSPYFMSRNGNVLIIIAEPGRPVQDMVFARKLVSTINEARRGAAVSISCAGAHISAVLDEAEMKKNILISVASSLLVVLGIFYAAYRRLLPTLLIPLILASSVLFALAAAGLFLSSIHIISFAFTALITGIGTDYSIHIYDRFHTERASGRNTEEALRLALLDTGHGVFTAAVTTGIPFLALMISEVRALFELGLLVGLGVIFSFYVTFLFLPPLLIFMEKHYPITYRPIPGLGLSKIWRITLQRPGIIITASLLMLVALCCFASQVTFDGDLKNLQPRHSEAFLAQEKLERNLSIAPRQLLIAVEGKELADVLARTSAVDVLAEKFHARQEIAAWSSLTRLVNSQSIQTDIARQLREYFAGGRPVDVLRSRLDHLGFAQEPFQPFLDASRRMAQAAPVNPEEIIARFVDSPFKGVIDRHLVKDAAGYHALVYIHYKDDSFNLPAFQAGLTSIDPAARLSSLELVSSQLKKTVRDSFTGAFSLGGLFVLFLLCIQFTERPTGIFYSLFPVAAALGCMLGIMALTGMGLNFMNAMVLVTIVGMGSDFGLYIRFRVSGTTPEEREAQYIQIGRSVFLSAMTTVVGFGSLAFTDYGAMSSIGWATNIGVGFITFFSLITLPAFMHLWSKRAAA